MNDLWNELGIVECNEPRETAKDTILSTAAILHEMRNQLDSIESAMYGVKVSETTAEVEPQNPPMLVMLRQQRDFAESILQTILHIREGLW